MPESDQPRNPPNEQSEATPKERADAVVSQAESLQSKQAKPEDIRQDMLRSVITEPLLSDLMKALAEEKSEKKFDVIIALNEFYKNGIRSALAQVEELAEQWHVEYATVSHYCFACLTASQLKFISDYTREQLDKDGRSGAIVYRIWDDTDIDVTIEKSLTTVKADAAHRAFQANGRGIVWAVLDSGVQADHVHFDYHPPLGTLVDPTPFRNLAVREPVRHRDFTPKGRALADEAAARIAAEQQKAAAAELSATEEQIQQICDGPRTPQERELSQKIAAVISNARDTVSAAEATKDGLGHGTHVAGIIAGYRTPQNPDGDPVAGVEYRDEGPAEDVQKKKEKVLRKREIVGIMSGMAPRCHIVSMKVIADEDGKGDVRQTSGQGKVSWVLRAIDEIQKVNQYGKRIQIHGANLSLGYEFDPRWFACGQSPLCVEVNRLVKCGVVVVVSAGNSGFSTFINAQNRDQANYMDLSITDPGNAEFAITVGSTHKEMPHTYGVSYFSSRGPTGDGRLKPDLIAPGERILSCAAGQELAKYVDTKAANDGDTPVLYVEQTGTSMAAPHVSGAIAAFLSVRPEFIGQPEEVKDIFMANTIDLRRDRCFQGTGLLDLMKVLQAV